LKILLLKYRKETVYILKKNPQLLTIMLILKRLNKYLMQMIILKKPLLNLEKWPRN